MSNGNEPKANRVVIDLAEARAQRAGIITPRCVVDEVEERVDHIAAIVVTTLNRDGSTETFASTTPQMTAIGLLESAKFDVMFADDE